MLLHFIIFSTLFKLLLYSFILSVQWIQHPTLCLSPSVTHWKLTCARYEPFCTNFANFSQWQYKISLYCHFWAMEILINLPEVVWLGNNIVQSLVLMSTDLDLKHVLQFHLAQEWTVWVCVLLYWHRFLQRCLYYPNMFTFLL